MSEAQSTSLLQRPCKPDTIKTDVDTLRSQLTDMERELISLLVTVQRALGKESSIITRSERRRG